MGLRSWLSDWLFAGPELLCLSTDPEKDVTDRPLVIATDVGDEPRLVKNTAFDSLPAGACRTKATKEGHFMDDKSGRAVILRAAEIVEDGPVTLPENLTAYQLPKIEFLPWYEGYPMRTLDPIWEPSDDVDNDEVRCPECDKINSERAMNCQRCGATIDLRVRRHQQPR